MGVAATAIISATPAHAQEQPLIIARHLEINSLDPSRAFCDTCQIYLSSTYQGLVALGADNKSIEPQLAESWEVNDDQTVFTFMLSPDAVFSDGSPVEAKDVKWSFERLKNLKADASFMMSLVKSIETPDEKTVVVTMESPNSEFLGVLTAPYTGIVNSDVASEAGASAAEDAATADTAESWFQANSAGSGPYMLKSYAPDDELRFVRNEKFWGEKPAIAEIVIDETADAVSQAQALQSGAADIAMQIDPDTSKTIASPDLTLETVPSYNFIYVMFSPGAEGNKVPLTKEVRQALAYAIDYEGLIQFTVGGEGKPQASPIPNGFPGTADLPMPVEDLEKAKAMLAEAGLADGFELDAPVAQLNVYGVDLVLLMQKIQQDLARVNVKLNIQPVASAVWREQVAKPGAPFSARFYAPDYFGSAQYVQFFGMVPDSFWLTRASQGKEDLLNQKEAELLGKALAAPDAERETIYRDIALEMIDDRIIIPVVSPNLVLAHRNDVAGVRYSACCNLPLAELSRK
ncbi:ABC transporter substrate-binding protein [Aquamicrobium sp. LC103]|uniref:ABC transporter substrate-binding protein n=1 Tax=Aquamicrobium sp. LC103 TaxID=1120658 RepID=UPI001FF03930|nr:ABC transporter substrate-binding protein [Aquamicrobium sp. LC103]